MKPIVVHIKRPIKKSLWDGFDADLWRLGINPKERPMDNYNETEKQMKMIEGMESIKSLKSIDFNLTNDGHGEKKIIARLPEWLDMILRKIDFNDKWMVFYQYKNVWRSRKLDEVTSEMLREQAMRDIQGMHRPVAQVNMAGIAEEDYDFMLVSINLCQAIRLVNIGNYNAKVESSGRVQEVKEERIEDDPTYKRALESGIPEFINLAREKWNTTHRIKQTRKAKGGSFWKWLCTMPVNLERYMIFNTLDERTVKLMEEDNCLIYACKQFGLSTDIIDHMKDIIKVKHFSLSKLKEISEDTGITFIVEEKDGRKHIQGNQKGTVVPLLLYENHYMLNERVKISPYYIKHLQEISIDKKASQWPLEKRQIIDRVRVKNGKEYYSYDQPDYPLKLVLKTIFEVGGFEPLKMGDYMTYASTLYKYKLDPIDDLEYNPKFCCRLKAPYVRRGSHLLHGVNER